MKLQAPVLLAVVVPSVVPPSLIVTSVLACPVPLTAGFEVILSVAALPVSFGERPAAAWFHRGEAKVLFDFTVVDGAIRHITFRADPDVLAHVSRRDGRSP